MLKTSKIKPNTISIIILINKRYTKQKIILSTNIKFKIQSKNMILDS